MKKLIIILLFLITCNSFSQVVVRGKEPAGFKAGWVNVGEYFANGVIPCEADITDELQAAINTGKNVIIPRSTSATACNYIISSVITQTLDGQIIQGAGIELTRLFAGENIDTMFLIKGDYVIIRDMMLSGYHRCSYGILADTSCYSRYDNLQFWGFDPAGDDTATALYLNYSFSNTFTNIRCLDNELGVRLYIGNNCTFVGGVFTGNSYAQIYTDLSYQLTMHGGSVEGGSENEQYLWVIKNSAVSLYGVYTEYADSIDMIVIGDASTTSYINIYDSRIRIINCDSSSGGVFLSLNNCELQGDAVKYPDVPVIYSRSKHASGRVTWNNVYFKMYNYLGGETAIGNFTIYNYLSEMDKGEDATLVEYLRTESATHNFWINNN
jgi:hypothetical protein